MIGENAFCPKTGAPLSEERYYDSDGRSLRRVTSGETVTDPPTEGELTNGDRRSSRTGLFNYFRRCHRRHHRQNPSLYRAAALGLRRLKCAADGRQEWDIHLWRALKRWLDVRGYETQWMNGYASVRCPYCYGRLKYYDVGDDVYAHCATNCEDVDPLSEARTLVYELYVAAFPDESDGVERDDFLQFAD